MQEKVGRSESRLESYEEKRQKVSQFNLTSDIFFGKTVEDIDACQEVVQILTRKELKIKSVKTQYSIRNVENRSVVLDVLAEDRNGCLVNVEMHPQEDEDHVRRVRYHLSSLDMSYLEKGTDFESIPEVYLIYITKKDFIGRNRGINEIIRVVDGTGTVLNNGVHELYVNFEGAADTPEQRELLDYMVHSAADYETGTFPHLAARVRLLKEKKEGIDIMCDILDRERAEGKAEGMAAGIEAGIAAFILDNLEEHKTEEQILAKLVKRFSLSQEEARKYLAEYIPKD